MLQEKLQGTMNVGAMTHKRLNAVYIASPTRKSIARAGGPHFESHFPLYGAKLLSNARSMRWGGGGGGGMGGFGIDWHDSSSHKIRPNGG